MFWEKWKEWKYTGLALRTAGSRGRQASADMEEIEEIPKHIFERFMKTFDKKFMPNTVRTKNINAVGLKTLIEKNTLVWSNSIYDTIYTYIDGLVIWGSWSSEVFVYFKKVYSDNTYKIYILTDDNSKVDMLLIGLNKFFTIDKI